MQNNLNKKQIESLKYIRNSIMHGYFPSVRDIQKVLGYKSPRSAALIIDSLIEKKILGRKPDNNIQILKDVGGRLDHAQTVEIPLIGMVPCGTPILAEENLEAMIPVSKGLTKPGHQYFLLRASGDSMDSVGISDGNLLLIKQQPTADNGQIVVALINNEATVKEFYRTSKAIILKPRSKNKTHKPIILTDDFQIQGVVVEIIPGFE
jgi:repressor LexA